MFCMKVGIIIRLIQNATERFLFGKYTLYMLSIDDYSTAKEMAEIWGITTRMVIHYCDHNLIPGAVRKGSVWLIPTASSKPDDRRTKSYRSRQSDGETEKG